MAVTSRRRNTEKRKEKSRDAARSRRGKEAEIFSELATQLPLAAPTIDALDKASVMRLLLSTLKVRSVMSKRPKLEVPDEGSLEAKLDTFYPKALDGFMLALSKEGDIIYVSESVAKVLGMQQIDLMGQSIFEYAHPCDHEEIQEVLSPRSDSEEEAAKTIFIRLKCTLTSKGRNVNLKSASYKVIKLTGKYVPDETVDIEMPEDEPEEMDVDDEDTDEDEENLGRRRVFRPHALPHFLAIAEGIHHPSNIEVPLDRRTFTSRHHMNMKFTDCDERIHRMIGYQPDELVGQSFFGFHHATDSKMMEKTFKDLCSKGQACTGQYRFLAKNGGYVWMVTEATVIFNNKSQKPECVVCVHYCLSHVEQHGRILASVQNATPTAAVSESSSPRPALQVPKKEEPKRPSCQRPRQQRREHIADIFTVPVFSTEAVFDDKTEDMDQEFYFPPGIKKMESFGRQMNLYDDFAANIDSSDMMPFSETRKKGSSTVSPASMSPESTMSAPSPSSYLSTINVQDIDSGNDAFIGISEHTSVDLLERAPFISMSDDEDFILSQPSQDNFLSMGPDFNPGIFGSTESVFSLKDELYEGPPKEKKSKTAVEMLVGSTVLKSIERPQDKMMMKLKRPLDRSCLETGPPAAKMTKYVAPVCLLKRPTSVMIEPKKDCSVLKNLLLCGEDKQNGYSVKQKQSFQHLLTAVTSHDVEVNAPTWNGSRLLTGQEIVNALNMNRK